MCNILALAPGSKLNDKSFFNMVMNNRDGWGLVTLNDGKMEVRKEFSEKGNDPEAIGRIIEEMKDHTRFLHVRYNTVGKSNELNAHPFTVYNGSNNTRIEFMHNGTLSDFRPGAGSDSSDTRNFAENFLAPLLERWHTDGELANLEDPFLKELLKKYFPHNNRGLLISNKHKPLYLGNWSTVKGEDGEDIPTSNTDYFSYVHSTRDKYTQTKAVDTSSNSNFRGAHGHNINGTASGAAKSNDGGEGEVIALPGPKNANAQSVTPISRVSKPKSQGRYVLPDEINSLIDLQEDTIERDDVMNFFYLSPFELQGWMSSNMHVGVNLFFHIVSMFCEIHTELADCEDELNLCEAKHEKATNVIASFAAENKELKNRIAKYEALYGSLEEMVEMERANASAA